MKRPAIVFLAVLAYFLCYHLATRGTRQMMAADDGDGIAWLRQEFALPDVQTRAVAALPRAPVVAGEIHTLAEMRCRRRCEGFSARRGERVKMKPSAPALSA